MQPLFKPMNADNQCLCPNEQEEMQNQIREVAFAAHETALYLNSHPNDTRVLNRHNYYAEMLHKLTMEYTETFNDPLTNLCPAQDYWTYIEGPWPWQGKCRCRKGE